VADTVAVMDAADVDRAVLVGLCSSTWAPFLTPPSAVRAVYEALAHAIAAEIGRPASYRPVETDGAARAAALLAELI
jgi:hypothetical protein